MFDIEIYKEPLFAYADLPHRDRTFADYEAKVQQRGAELMRAFTVTFRTSRSCSPTATA